MPHEDGAYLGEFHVIVGGCLCAHAACHGVGGREQICPFDAQSSSCGRGNTCFGVVGCFGEVDGAVGDAGFVDEWDVNVDDLVAELGGVVGYCAVKDFADVGAGLGDPGVADAEELFVVVVVGATTIGGRW